MSGLLEIEEHDDALLIRFTRPEVRNPLSVAVLERLAVVFDDLGPGLKRIVFTGTHDVFASGADLREIANVDEGQAREFALRGQTLMSRISRLEQTTIAAINGYCFGGALDLALACDKRIASPNAKFAHPGAGLGIITGWGGTQRLPRLIGTALANEMFFRASPVEAERALAIGLIDAINEDALEMALEIARHSEI